MRVLFLTHRLPYAPNRGDRIRAYHIARVLAARHDVHLVSFVHDDEERDHATDLKSVVASVTTVNVNRIARTLVAGCALPTRIPLTHLLLHNRAMHGVLANLRHSLRPDVVLAYCTSMARYAMEPPLAGIPWILDMVDVDSAKWEALGKSGQPLLRPVYRREARLLGDFEVRAMRAAAATCVVTEKERATLAAVAPDVRVHVIPNGIDVRTFSPPSAPSETPNAVFCGVFNYPPNEAGAIWLARDVWPLVVAEMPAARLSLVGMHPTPAVKALASDRVQVTGAVPDVRPFLWNAALGVAPLQVARGVQNKVLEAIAAGLPAIVTPAVFDGLPPVVRPACRVAADTMTMARAILSLLAESGTRRRETAAAADLNQLSWEAQLAPLGTLVEDTLVRR